MNKWIISKKVKYLIKIISLRLCSLYFKMLVFNFNSNASELAISRQNHRTGKIRMPECLTYSWENSRTTHLFYKWENWSSGSYSHFVAGQPKKSDPSYGPLKPNTRFSHIVYQQSNCICSDFSIIRGFMLMVCLGAHTHTYCTLPEILLGEASPPGLLGMVDQRPVLLGKFNITVWCLRISHMDVSLH